MDKNTKKWIYLFLLSGIWGSSYILIKKGLVGLSPIQLACFRIVITSFILVFFGLSHVKNLSRNQWKWTTSGIAVSFNQFCLLQATRQTMVRV